MIQLELNRLVKRAKNYLDSISVAIDPEISTLLHRYICVLLSSNVDKAIQLILTEFARSHGSPEIARFVAKKYQRGTNYNTERVIQTLNLFDPEWGEKFSDEVGTSRLKEQLDALYGLRNSISHGEQVSVSRPSLNEYYETHGKIILLIKTVVLGT